MCFKKYNLQTFGCQMNENDSEKLSGMLEEMGYTETDERTKADIIIFNTCCVRENAEAKFYGHLGALKLLKEQKPDLIIAVCGCMPQQPNVVDVIKSKYKQVDLLFGTHNLYKFPEMLYNVLNSGDKVYEIWDEKVDITENIPMVRKDSNKAWVSVMYGCNNFCTYCIVPYVRGREKSRKPEDVLKEVEGLATDGYKEITLLGQNVNSYGMDFDECFSFAKLLALLNNVQGIERIRFMTSHPKDLSDDLIYAIRDCDKVVESIHLPIQSGSTNLLQRMNRKYTKEHYLALADKIRSIISNVSLSTDIIVGFPGETEEDFLNTLDLVEKVRFDYVYTFLYSRRKGTPAASFEDQITEETKRERFNRLAECQNKITREINESLIGKTLEVLVEGASKKNQKLLTGHTRSNKIVNFKGDSELIGKIINVKIDEANTWALHGEYP